MFDKDWTKRISIVSVLILVIFIFLSNRARTFVTETQILILPKTQITAENHQSIIENFKNILGSVAFFDSLKDKIEIGEIDELPSYKRKEFWNTKIRAERIDESGILRIQSFDKIAIESAEINQVAIKQLVLSAGQYYNIKTDLELRIIEKPITRSSIAQNYLVLIFQSFLFGIISYLVIFLFIPWFFLHKIDLSEINLQFKKRGEEEKSISKKKPFLNSSLPVFIEESYQFTKKNAKAFVDEFRREEKTKIEEVETKNISVSIISTQKKAVSPDNLPVSEDIPDFIFSGLEKIAEKKIEPKEEEVKTEENDLKREATPEEVKEKLNRLLRGE